MANIFDLEDFGWDEFFSSHFGQLNRSELTPARVTEEFKGSYRVRAERGEYLAEIAGKIKHQAARREDFPAVGDWVAILARPHEGGARIEFIHPRKTKLSRKAAGRELNEQIVAVNLDTVFVVSSLNRELNLRRIERYLTMVWDSGARPVILLNKADLCADAVAGAVEVESIALGMPVHLLSALEKTGLETVQGYLARGTTAAFVGSSGVGKSTIINALADTALRVQPVREHDDRGQHTTTSRQMIFLPGGGIVIDTPGMRELQLWNNEEGAERAFEDIAALTQGCRFRDCAHHGEPGCAIGAAVNRGFLPLERLESYRKLLAELRFQERKMNPEAARQDKAKWKKIHKAMRNQPEEF
ncbi:MAG TPA: ribosome small subunit-dependent GTPase A [Terriglobales bacterium]|nr:ribosome small subunit-dependent GTPase A [Terriglobales bacterium]